MRELDTREALLETVRDLRTALDDVLNQVTVEQIEAPGSFAAWSLKDLIAHLTGWRELTAIRLEAALADTEPTFAWPDNLDEEKDLDDINFWFYETNRNKPFDQVLQESNATFDRVERAIKALSDTDLFTPNLFPWLNWTTSGVGPAVIEGTRNHYYVEHEPDIEAWLESL